MRRYVVILTVILAFGLVEARSADAPGYFRDLETGLDTRIDDLGGSTGADAKLRKTLDKARRALQKASASSSYAGEIKATGKAAKLIEKKAAGETELLNAIDEAADQYAAEAQILLDAIQSALDDQALTGKAVKKGGKAVLKGAAALAKAEAAASPSKRIKQLSKAWKAALFAESLGGSGSGDLGAAWVVATLEPAESDVGADLDGDGSIDNQLALLLDLLDEFVPEIGDTLVSDLLGESPTVLALQMWDVGSWAFDPDVTVGILLATDTDGNTEDNFTGTETFDAGAAMGLDGYPVIRGETSLQVGGRYSVDVGDGLVLPLIGEFGLDLGATVVIAGTVTEESHEGVIGFALPAEAVEVLMGAFVPEDQLALVNLLLNGLYDIDTDGDGDADALSAALSFTAVTAILESSIQTAE